MPWMHQPIKIRPDSPLTIHPIRSAVPGISSREIRWPPDPMRTSSKPSGLDGLTRKMIVGVVVLMILGIYWMRKIIKIRV
jgi:hypothetical protein